MNEPNIYQRINEVRKKVDYIKKDKKIQNYMAVTHDTVTSEIRPFLIEYGIIITVSQLSGQMIDTGTKTSSGASMLRYEASYTVSFINMYDAKDFVSVVVHSHALDFGDKAPGKGMSYATKYAMLKTFSIETGENEESRQELKPKPIELISPDQVKEIEDKIKTSGVDDLVFLKYYKVNKIDDLSVLAYKQASVILDKKITEKEAAK